MQKMTRLIPFSKAENPQSLARVQGIQLDARITTTEKAFLIEFSLTGKIKDLVIPKKNQSPSRIEGLWEHTCFEVFLTPQAENEKEYFEFNSSPSGDWASFHFDRYRSRTQKDNLPSLIASETHWIIPEHRLDHLIKIPRHFWSSAQKEIRMGLSAVLEHEQGALSFWSLSHPKDRPDFHDERGFLIELSSDA